MSSNSLSALFLTRSSFGGGIGEIDATNKLLPVYEFKKNKLVVRNFDFCAEDVVAKFFEETKTGQGITAVSNKATKTRNNARIREN